MLRRLKTVSLLLVLATCGCDGGGGSGKTFITRHPNWNYEAYERIAIVPFHYPKNKPGAREAALQATYMLEDLFATNTNFTSYL